MSFLNPFFLLALIAVGLPLVIHLLNLRKPQKVSFSALSFFRELKNTTIKRIRIKKYLLLFLRLAAIACFAFVLARPFLPPGYSSGNAGQAPALNGILIDNSISMSRIGRQGPLFEYAKEIVGSIQESARDDDRFIIQFSNGDEATGNILSSTNVDRLLADKKVSESGNFIDSRLRMLMEALDNAPYENKNLFLITDTQRSQVEPLQGIEFDEITMTVIDVGDVGVQNTYLNEINSSTSMLGAGMPFNIEIELANEGQVSAINQFVTMEFEGENVGQFSVSLEPEERKTFSFDVTPGQAGSASGKVFIEGDEFQADNINYFTVQVPEKRNVLLIRNSNFRNNRVSYTATMLQAAGENHAQLSYKEIELDELESENLTNYDSVILDGLNLIPEYSFNLLEGFVQNGGGLVFFPSENGDMINYNLFFEGFKAGEFAGVLGDYASFQSVAEANEILQEHPVFESLFEQDDNEELSINTPSVFYYLKFISTGTGVHFDLFTLNNGDPLIHEKRFGEGALIISSIGNDPGWSNFPVQPVYAPFYYRLLLYAASSDKGGFVGHTLGKPFSWVGNINADEAVIETGSDQIRPYVDVVPSGVRLRYSAEEWVPGWVTIKDGVRDITLSVNLDKSESTFNSLNKDQMEDLLDKTNILWVEAADIGGSELQNQIASTGFGREIWSWFMIAGLLFLVAESVVSRWYKAESLD
ncbi:BatA domain-containing protein [Gracilimonas sp. Q87]|uniref:BatA domain-containing protein n=1 Tax=Gracilimonas sp. Q87 TaxID=3384766 RepID=UPI0039840D3F